MNVWQSFLLSIRCGGAAKGSGHQPLGTRRVHVNLLINAYIPSEVLDGLLGSIAHPLNVCICMTSQVFGMSSQIVSIESSSLRAAPAERYSSATEPTT